jgi:hypothetical protein
MRATIIKATRGAVATIHSGSDRRKKSKTIESTLDQVPGDFHSKYTARTRTLVTKMMFWALAGVTFSAAKIVSCNKKRKKFMVYLRNYFNCSTLGAPVKGIDGNNAIKQRCTVYFLAHLCPVAFFRQMIALKITLKKTHF